MEIKNVLDQNNFRFNKKLGQNFITDTNLLSAIVSDSGVTSNDVVVEIGAGAGTLTKELAKCAKKVIAFEIDKNLEKVLNTSLSGLENVELVFEDIMKVSISELERKIGGPFKVVANLPYYITTPILMLFLENSENVVSLTVMMQKEVADRMAAKAGTKDYGRITVAVDYFGDASVTRKVSRKMFYPEPNVDSAVVRIDRNAKYICDRVMFKRVVKCAFAMRRKTLANNLTAGFAVDKERATNIVEAIGKNSNVRGEALTPQEFVRLTEEIKKNV